MTLPGREERVRDFEERCSGQPDNVYDCSTGRYVPIHPFADEPAQLERLGMQARACRSVDAYWYNGTDVAFA